MEEKKKSKKGIIVTILILIIIILVGAGGYFGYKIWKDNQTTGTDWADIYLDDLGDKISDGKYKDTENSSFGFVQFEENEKPAMVLNYETETSKVTEISVLNSENNVKSKTFETEKENEVNMEMLYDIETKEYNWYQHEKKQDETEIFTEISQDDIEEGTDIPEDKIHQFTKEEMTEQEVEEGEIPSIPKFDEEFIKPEIELNETDIDLKDKDIDKKELKEKVEKAVENYKSQDENISDEVQQNVDNSLQALETKKEEIKTAEEEKAKKEAEENVNVADIYKQYINEGKYKNEVSEWVSEVKKYSILDINQDGTEELLLSNEGEGGFYATLVCTYDRTNKQVVVVENIPNSYGVLRYDSTTKEVIYSEFKPFADAASNGFYILENNKLTLSKIVGQDMGQYFVEENGNKTNIQKEESSNYFKNAKDIEFTDISSMELSQSNTTEQNSGNGSSESTDKVFRCGMYWLNYGTYIGSGGYENSNEGAKLVLNKDGTYTMTQNNGTTKNGKYISTSDGELSFDSGSWSYKAIENNAIGDVGGYNEVFKWQSD